MAPALFNKKLLYTVINLLLGLSLGLGSLEILLRANPALLLPGMALPAPVDTPLDTQRYEVYSSDADIFYWQSAMIRPIPEEEDKLEASVHFQTDEFGFSNPPPLPSKVDLVVLGRSFSLGAQASEPWPRLVEKQTGLKVLNLSQAGSSMATKFGYLKQFGLARRPGVMIIEVLPSMDIIGSASNSDWIIGDLPIPIIQNLGRKVIADKPTALVDSPVYPLSITIKGREVKVAFYSYYLSSLTVNKDMLKSSRQWANYTSDLGRLIQFGRSKDICPVLLYVPTKENIYFPLADHPNQLDPVLNGLHSWKLSDDRELVQSDGNGMDIREMQVNAASPREVLAEFAAQQDTPFVDPTDELAQAVLVGNDPYMSYDTHWSETGHRIIAEAVEQLVQSSGCP